MVSPEFKSVVADKNLLRTRIMLKDSLIIDPTFVQFSEMISYAKMNLPNLMVDYDEEYLEEDSSKWTSETMNEELVQLVTNFSDIRIRHLKKVVSKVLAKEAEAIKRKRLVQNAQNSRSAPSSSMSPNRSNINSAVRKSELKKTKQKETLRKMSAEARKVNKILYEVDKNHDQWKPKNIDDLEQAAKEILKAIHEYRVNSK